MFSLTAPAKINLSLDIKYRRPDGYHEVDMVMQSISLADELSFIPDDEIILTCSHSFLPTDHRNIAWRAAQVLKDYSGVRAGVKIHIQKNIPVAAGLAGGSADAAGVLIGLNQYWRLGLTTGTLMEIGVKLGADVPFCIMKGTARAEGIGEKLTPVDSQLRKRLYLVTPNTELSTASVYRRFCCETVAGRPNIKEVLSAITEGNEERLIAFWGNVLESPARAECPVLDEMTALFQECGLSRFLMSGSGPTMFLLDPPSDLIAKLESKMPDVWFRSYAEMIE